MRLIVDLSTLARWQGPPVGIPRCQAKYADYALREIPEAIFTVFDPRSMRYRPLIRDAAAAIIHGRITPDMNMMPDATNMRRRTIDSVPHSLRPAYWWVTKFRRKLLGLLENWRFATADEARRARLAQIQDLFITDKVRSLYYRADGVRIERPNLDSIIGPPVELTADDITVAMQSDWSHTSIEDIARMRQAAGSRHVVLCHDIIPILFPEWYSGRDVDLFTRYYDRAFAVADRVIFTSNCSARDADAYARSIGVTIADSRVVPMGTDVLPRQAADTPLPKSLERGRYVLFVSTIEPRKNHAMLVEAWRRLVRSGVVARTGFKMVFVGRRGWMMGSFLEDIAADPEIGPTIVHLSGIPDETLAALYQNAGFSVYPPLYEGYGLPPVESIASGRAVIASNAGPIAEVVGEFGVCLDPHDVGAWAERMGAWMTDPAEREALAAHAASAYRPITWDEAAKNFFAAVTSTRHAPAAAVRL